MRARTRQSGYALAAISLLGMAAMGSAAVLIAESGVNEGSAIEDDLVRVRANWAMNGHLTYVLSRARQDGACHLDCSDSDTTRSETSKNFSREIHNAVPAKLVKNAGSQRRWSYGEINTEYAIDTAISGTDTGTLVDGQFKLDTRIAISLIRLQSVDDALNRIPSIETTVCAGLSNPGDNCPTVVTNENTSGIVRIVDFRVVR